MLNPLESESIDIIREAVATGRNPVMMYSVGKDSSVMLHLGVQLPRTTAVSAFACGYRLEV